jgi:hypothetical protein
MRAVLAAFNGGARTSVEIQAVTGLDTSVVAAILDHLVRSGRVATLAQIFDCGDGCGTCRGCPLGARSVNVTAATTATRG